MEASDMATSGRTRSRKANSATDGKPASSRSKRNEILWAATEHFGRAGYEDTKWADVAADVGIGSTALYHYFESKLHCLFVIMADALEAFRTDFKEHVEANDAFLPTLVAHLRGGFELTEQEVLRNRVLVAEQGLVGIARTSPREEEARRIARERTRDLEETWATFLTRGMAQGEIPEADPRLLARAVLGLYNSVWHWYRPRGIISVDELAKFFVPRELAVLGVSPETTERLLKDA
jgi:AcrR family transcriptional regulator